MPSAKVLRLHQPMASTHSLATSVSSLDSFKAPPLDATYPPGRSEIYVLGAGPSPYSVVPPFDREIARTPSPTPSEHRALNHAGLRMIDWRSMCTLEYWKMSRIVTTFVILFVITTTVLFIILKDQVVDALDPVTHWLKETPGGFVIPIVLLVVLSFPPLFGHEVVAIICGTIWGIGIGFAIVATGVFLGEVANFYVFKHWFRGYAEKQEKKKIVYGCFAKVVRDGGVKISLISRYSVIPGHLITAVYATCGMADWIFLIGCVCALPKHIVLVLVGASAGAEASWVSTLSTVILIVTVVVTIGACIYIVRRIEQVKSQVIYERRKARLSPGLEPDNDSDTALGMVHVVHSGRDLGKIV